MPTAAAGASATKVLKRANPGTIHDKFLVGYQGWFTCANDGPPIGQGHHGWLHWVNQPLPANGRPNTDLWPDTSAYDPSELYTVEGLAHKDGSPAKVFSSRDARTVRRHFHWMAEHGVDGAFLQRFVGQVDPEEAGNRDERYGGTRRLRDEVGRRVREAAEAEGRVWAIMYDASGVPADKILRIVSQDFTHLLTSERILSSPAYLREHGRPVVALWGFGLSDSPVPPHTARAVFDALRAIAREHTGEEIYIFAGVPSHWRTPGAGDAHGDPGWAGVWLGDGAQGVLGAVDALSPWSVGRFSDAAEVERWAAERWAGDAEMVATHNERLEFNPGAGRRVDYVPVVLPGGSGFNLSEGKWAFNGIKRNGGKFLWAQIFHAKRLKGVRSLYGAMWDEYDEGTAFLPVIEKKRLLPQSETWPFLALDEDGYDLPSDWYMRIAGFAAEGLRSERRIHDSFPSKELQDYWSSRPKYEEDDSVAGSSSAASRSAGGSGSGSGSAASAPAPASTPIEKPKPTEEKETESERLAREAKAQFDAWAEEQRRKEAEGEEMPPPAYSLEDEGPGPAVAQEQAPVQQQPVQQQQAPMQQQQEPVQQQQQPYNAQPQQQQQQSQSRHNSYSNAQQQPQSQSRPNSYGNAHPVPPVPAEAAVDALAGDFAARARIGASPPPLHPSHPGRQQSGGPSQQQGYGRGGGANLGDRPPLHPAHPQAGRVGSQGSVHTVASGDAGGAGYGPGGRVASPEVQGQGQVQWGARPGSGAYQQPQHTGGSASPVGSAPYPPQGAYQQHQNTGGAGAYPAQGQQPQWQQQQNAGGQGYQHAQHTGGSAGSSGSAYPPSQPPRPASAYPGQGGPAQAGYAPPAGPPQGHGGYAAPAGPPPQGHAPYGAQAGPHQQYSQSPQHTGGSSSSAPYPAQGGPQPHQQHAYQQQPQHTGGSSSSASSYAPQNAGGQGYQHAQHTGGSAGSSSSYAPAQPPRPASAYPGQAGAAGYAPPSGPPPQGHTPYAAQGGASGSGLGHSSSLSARPTPSMYPGAASPPPQGLSVRPDSAPRPTTPGYASHPGGGGGGAYAASPPPHGAPPHASLAPRPDSVRPTTPGYGGQPSAPHHHPPGPMGPPQQTPYSNQFPSHNPNGPPASYPGSSYNAPAKLPSPEISGPAFPPGPMASPYGGYQGSPPHQTPPFPGQTFPSPQQGGYPMGPPPPGSPPYPPAGPSFPQSDNSGYFYQQPQQSFPGAGYSPQPYNNYAQQPQGPWVPDGGPPPMPHRPGSLPQPAYGQQPYGGCPSFPTAAAPPSAPLGFGLDPLDKIVGRRTREQLEGAVDSIAQSSTKLLNKFR